jgi:hypothetical protein
MDFSASVPADSFETYCRVLNDEVLRHLGRFDRLVVRPIDYSSEQRSEVLFEVDLSQQDFSNKRDGYAHKQEKEKERLEQFLAEEAKKLIPGIMRVKEERKPLAKYTDIIGGLNAAQPDLSDKAYVKNLIIIFSDMIQESRDVNLTELHLGNIRWESDILKQIDDKKRIPNLKGAVIFVFGAGETPEISGDYYRAVRGFWSKFFQKASANFNEADYGYRNQDRLHTLLDSLHRSSVPPGR